jgi:hypothetical protein
MFVTVCRFIHPLPLSLHPTPAVYLSPSVPPPLHPSVFLRPTSPVKSSVDELQWHCLGGLSSAVFGSVADADVMRTSLRPPSHIVEYCAVLLRTDRISAECALCTRDDFDGYALLDGLYASSPADASLVAVWVPAADCRSSKLDDAIRGSSHHAGKRSDSSTLEDVVFALVPRAACKLGDVPQESLLHDVQLLRLGVAQALVVRGDVVHTADRVLTQSPGREVQYCQLLPHVHGHTAVVVGEPRFLL